MNVLKKSLKRGFFTLLFIPTIMTPLSKAMKKNPPTPTRQPSDPSLIEKMGTLYPPEQIIAKGHILYEKLKKEKEKKEKNQSWCNLF